MKTSGTSATLLRATAILMLTAGAASAQNGGGGFLWNRNSDWVPGSVQGGTANNPGPGAGSNTVWQYEFTQGGAFGSANPWYLQPTTLMTWDSGWWETGWGVWSKGNDTSPPILREKLIHNVHQSTVADVPLVRWRSPFSGITDLSIVGNLTLHWDGLAGLGRPVDVDVVIAKQTSAGATTLLFANGTNPGQTPYVKPNNFPSVGDMITIPIDIHNITMDIGDSIIITHRGRSGLFPLGAWVNLTDNLAFNAIPSPGTLGLLGAGAMVMARRRRR